MESLCNASLTSKLWMAVLTKGVRIMMTYVHAESDMLPFLLQDMQINTIVLGLYYTTIYLSNLFLMTLMSSSCMVITQRIMSLVSTMASELTCQ